MAREGRMRLALPAFFYWGCVLTVVGGLLVAPEHVSAGADGVPAASAAITFEADIQPLLTRYGCNSGACHGKARGQNGFALSLFGFDDDFDYRSLAHASRARRISVVAPEHSMLLRKATGQMPHGGGKRLAVDSPHYRTLLQWIQQGAKRTPRDAPKLVGVSVSPPEKVLSAGESFELAVAATYSDGTQRDVSNLAAYQSNDATVAKVLPDTDGRMEAGPLPGEATVMVRFMGHIAVCPVTIPGPATASPEYYSALPQNNPIDRLVWDKLQRLGVLPSETTSEPTFHRRAFLRAIGRLPTAEETREYLADSRGGKREDLVDRLLDRPEYADFWANKWADLIRPNPYRTGAKTVWNLHDWLRKSFRENRPYDQFVRDLVAAKGTTYRHGAPVIFRDRRDPVEMGAAVSQLFLGVRLECAKCHHHPFEVWSQDDFFGFAAFFARVGHVGGLSEPISFEEEMVYVLPQGQLLHERTGSPVQPQVLKGQPQQIPEQEDPRDRLVDWMLDPANPYFAKVMANRVWTELMGRGLVDPVDDLRSTNPPSNEPLLNFLAEDFRANGYDIQKLIRTIMTSHVFGLSSQPSANNTTDHRNFSRYYRQRIRAEVHLDAVNDVLGTEDVFTANPPGSRAMQVWTHRTPSIFLETFGRPDMNQNPPCERTFTTTTPQILHLMNSPLIHQKLTAETSRPAQLAQSHQTDTQLVEEIYLSCYNRFPTPEEMREALAEFPGEGRDRRTAVEDLFWVLLSTPEFYFVD